VDQVAAVPELRGFDDNDIHTPAPSPTGEAPLVAGLAPGVSIVGRLVAEGACLIWSRLA
jgi:hypothetical protein